MKTLPQNSASSWQPAHRSAGLIALLARCLLAVLFLREAGSAVAATVYHTVSETYDSPIPGSLRTAINEVNAVPAGSTDTHIIRFSLGTLLGSVNTIQVRSALPVIVRNCIIDGTTEFAYTGSPLVELDGSLSWDSSQQNYLKSSGLEINGCKVTIKALVINRFWVDGVTCTGGELKLLGCRIGTNAAGTVARPNQEAGVYLSDSNTGTVTHTIGDTSANGRNLISGNKGDGIYIGCDGGAAGELVVENNFVGTDITGLAALPNTGDGIVVAVSTGQRPVRIGRTGGGRNVISGNSGSGLTKYHYQYYNGNAETWVRNNLIGLGVNGTTVVSNGGFGVELDNQKITVGGSVSGEGNTISGNSDGGVGVSPYWGEDFDVNKTAVLLGNYIGTAQDGLAARPNGGSGIWVDDSYGLVRIGTATTGNVIAGNNHAGVSVTFGGATLLRNLIGLNKNAQALGNGGAGIDIDIGAEVVAGNSTASGANIIGSNSGAGISISSDSTAKIAGNYIGLSATLADRGNGGAGVEVNWDDYTSPYGIEIGGTGAGAGNSIAFNNLAGVRVTEDGSQGVAFCFILGNSIWANGGPGVDLGPPGVTPNDAQDADTGANGRQNFPAITSATATKVFGTLHSKPNNTYRIELFTAEAHASGYGTGRIFLGAATALTDATGNAQWAKNGLSLTSGQLLTATATLLGPPPTNNWDDLDTPQWQDTSEFCLNKAVSNPDFPDVIIGLSAATYTGNETAGVINIPVIRSGLTNAIVTMGYRTLDGSAVAGQDFTAVSGTLTFQSGVTQLNISIPVTNDHTYELSENFRVQILNPGPGVIPGAITEAVVNLPDADGVPVISIAGSASILEGHSGDTLLPIQVTLSKAAIYTSTVHCRIHTEVIDSGTASHPSDYQGGNVTVTFAPGETQKSFNLTIHGDTESEPDEGVIISVDSVSTSGGWEILSYDEPDIGPANTCYATIRNDDDVSVFQFATTAVSASENSGSAYIAVTRTGGLSKMVSVKYAITGGTAASGADYTTEIPPGQLYFAPDQATFYLPITLINDGTVEGAETLTLQLSSSGSSNSTVGTPAQCTLTITDPPPPPPSISGRVFSQANSQGLPGVVITLSGAAEQTFTTSADGQYSFPSLTPGASYTVSVALEGYLFTPATKTISGISAQETGVDFSGILDVVPDLAMEAAIDGRLILYWPALSTGWKLMSSETLEDESWTPVGTAPITRAGYKSVYLTPEASRQFFRLQRN